MKNYFKMQLQAIGENEAFARNVVASFAVVCSPNLEELNDLKTAVSEAVTNVVVHAYDNNEGILEIYCEVDERENSITVSITDYGKGIDDVEQALEPLFTTKADEERSGMGFTIMQSFMDEMTLRSTPQNGTSVSMKKVFGKC